MNAILAAILIPILYNGPGEHGSRWYTYASVNHFGTHVLDGRGVVFLSPDCPIPEGCERGELENGYGAIVGPQSLGGLWLHPVEGDRVEVQAHFGERTRHAGTEGVELPIARDEDFRSGRFGLPAVRLDGGHEHQVIRTTLRVYALDPSPGQHVRIEMRGWYNPAAPVPEAVQIIALNPGDDLHPAYAQLDLQDAFPQVQQGSVRIDIIPETVAGVTPRVWAFATVTHNATNEVTVVSPH
jgi:hypothetical protein